MMTAFSGRGREARRREVRARESVDETGEMERGVRVDEDGPASALEAEYSWSWLWKASEAVGRLDRRCVRVGMVLCYWREERV